MVTQQETGVFVETGQPKWKRPDCKRQLDEVVSFRFEGLGEFFGVVIDSYTYPDHEQRPQWIVQPLRGFLEEIARTRSLRLGPRVDEAYCYGKLRAGLFPNGQVMHVIADHRLRPVPPSFATEHADWLREFRVHENYRR